MSDKDTLATWTGRKLHGNPQLRGEAREHETTRRVEDAIRKDVMPTRPTPATPDEGEPATKPEPEKLEPKQVHVEKTVDVKPKEE